MNPKSLPSTTTFTPVPDPLLGDVLQSIDSLAELKCILRALWHIHRKKGALRCVTLGELRADPVLQGELDEDEIADAMNGGARRGIFARASVNTERGRTTLFVLNQETHRAALRRAVAGTLTLPQGDEDSTAEPPSTKKRPNVFDLYEQEIGMITPLVADELKSAEADYPREWTETAIREAALSGKRSWPYVRAILRRWEREGKTDGKFGRNTKARDPRGYIEEYVRRRGTPPGG